MLYRKANVFQKTNGIYVNIPGQNIYGWDNLSVCSMDTTAAAGSSSSLENPANVLLGNETVVLIGWGVDNNVTDFLSSSGNLITLSYWIVRFSYGSQFGDNGYLKIAQSNLQHNINTRIGIDRIVLSNSNQQKWGGALTFEPLSGTNKLSTRSNPSWCSLAPWIFLAFVLLLVIITLLILFWQKKKWLQ